MENTCTLQGVCQQLCRIFAGIEGLTGEIGNASKEGYQDLADEYANMRMQELEQAQRLTLVLTEMIIDEIPENKANEDNEGVFVEGELSDNVGDETDKETGGKQYDYA